MRENIEVNSYLGVVFKCAPKKQPLNVIVEGIGFSIHSSCPRMIAEIVKYI